LRLNKTKPTDEYRTPQWLFDAIDEKFKFTIDAAATEENKKCERYCQDFLVQGLGPEPEIAFLNPPYSATKDWVLKACKEHEKNIHTIVMLIPVTTDCIYWHEQIAKQAAEIWFLKSRPKFVMPGRDESGPLSASSVIVFKPREIYKDPSVPDQADKNPCKECGQQKVDVVFYTGVHGAQVIKFMCTHCGSEGNEFWVDSFEEKYNLARQSWNELNPLVEKPIRYKRRRLTHKYVDLRPKNGTR